MFAERSAEAVERAAAIWTRAALLEPGLIEPLIEATRARIWLVEHDPRPARRREHAEAAVATARACGERAAQSATCDFWLGAALGVRAREKKLSAMGAASEVENLFRQAAASDPGLEQGGPDRALALLYARAPGWPFGPGNARRAVEHARRAVELAPSFPPNHLALAEALERARDRAAARRALGEALRLALEARDRGDPDAPEWVEQAQGKLGR